MNNTNNPTDTPTAEGQEATSMPEELAQAIKERDEFLDQLQRSRADFANYQKRSKAQADQNQAYAVGSLAQDIVAVLDNFDRALEAAAKSPGASVIVDGLAMVHKQLLGGAGQARRGADQRPRPAVRPEPARGAHADGFARTPARHGGCGTGQGISPQGPHPATGQGRRLHQARMKAH